MTESVEAGLAESDICCTCCKILPFLNDVRGCCICVDTQTLGCVLVTEALVVEPGEGGWQTDKRVSVVFGWSECRSSLTFPLLP